MPSFHRTPVGAYSPNYRPGSKRDAQSRAAANARTPEQKAASIALVDSICASMELTPAERGIEKIKDREARVAVEGNTDMNHDNLEAAPVDHYARDTADLDRTRVLLANCIMNCGTRIYEGDDHVVVPPNDEFYCAECAKAEAAE